MPLSYFSIDSHVIKDIENYCHSQLPFQGYGILAGQAQRITHFFPITNTNACPCSFEFDPRAYLEIIKKLRDHRLDWIGIVHSHPLTEAYPSIRDLNQWCYQEKSCWILSFKEKELKLCAYYIQSGQVTPIIYEIL
ncbi:Mov34/MPN/PAD-1 family protein [Thermoflavimicrobium dichotomicum]|uniref:Proteasome lid subunit RPN8/RPN11, contains Jab1/MPN metalloenzyme (JAMM) motif n=1 Tax=Thermoflavimicrobium dichotomicum TaxID=46223 RepID=A0A1I3LYK6_9BACL|nr:M67 family metallopeptidase [Thermoflavimicrobium dichotomicum]SFI89516.1 Proteasome lid subunit RPN8/RPN11, contains Jab1/MPN metalloenzyme (JAMM) motif [Thermoflavimicrobium dichotomicum]